MTVLLAPICNESDDMLPANERPLINQGLLEILLAAVLNMPEYEMDQWPECEMGQ